MNFQDMAKESLGYQEKYCLTLDVGAICVLLGRFKLANEVLRPINRDILKNMDRKSSCLSPEDIKTGLAVEKEFQHRILDEFAKLEAFIPRLDQLTDAYVEGVKANYFTFSDEADA